MGFIKINLNLASSFDKSVTCFDLLDFEETKTCQDFYRGLLSQGKKQAAILYFCLREE
jgi:hypothetical protein